MQKELFNSREHSRGTNTRVSSKYPGIFLFHSDKFLFIFLGEIWYI